MTTARSRRWEEVGPFTLDVAREATQNNGLTTEWSGRMTAMAVDPKCDSHDCRLYVGAAGGGVWRTDDALDRNPRWKPLERGLDTTSIGALLIDPTDKSGRTIYVGTGEPSGSGDSEAGLGLYKSTDRGEHWKLVPGSYAVAKDRGIGEIAVDPKNPRHIWIGTTVARHAGSGVSGGRFTPPGAPTIGLYESTNGGASFQLRFNLPQDPVNPNSPERERLLQGRRHRHRVRPGRQEHALLHDVRLRRLPSDGRRVRRRTSTPAQGPTRPASAFAMRSPRRSSRTARPGSTSTTAGTRSQAPGGSHRRRLARASLRRRAGGDAGVPDAVEPDSGDPGFSSFDICAQQCSYDMPITVSPKNPDMVMIGGQTQYGELPPYAGADKSNGRNIMLSRNAGELFTDMSGEAKDPFEANHPDVQILAFHPTNPKILFIGSDGGIVRTSGRYVNDSSDCSEPDRNLTGLNLTECQMFLSYIPDNLVTMNAGLRTLQFQDLQPNPSNPLGEAIGGTQDNGTLGFSGSGTWLNFVSGDGGQSGIDVTQGNIRYHTYFAQQGDVNFRGNDPQWWSWIYDPILFSPEASGFYIPFTADPVVSKTAFTGSESVWRTRNAGGDKDFLENNCNVLGGPRSGALNTGVDSGCGDWMKLGPGSALSLGIDNPTDKGGASGASYVVAIERAKTNNGTIWVGTRRGRIWVAKNADSTNAAAVVLGAGLLRHGHERAAERRRLRPRRHPGAAAAVPERHLGRSEGSDGQHGVHLVLGLRGLLARPARPRVQGRVQPGDRDGDMDRPEREPRRPADHGRRARRSERRSLCVIRLGRPPASVRRDELD